MDEYLALSLLIMGIAIGALLIIWGVMSLYFHLRKRKRQRRMEEQIRAREAADKAEVKTADNTDKPEE